MTPQAAIARSPSSRNAQVGIASSVRCHCNGSDPPLAADVRRHRDCLPPATVAWRYRGFPSLHSGERDFRAVRSALSRQVVLQIVCQLLKGCPSVRSFLAVFSCAAHSGFRDKTIRKLPILAADVDAELIGFQARAAREPERKQLARRRYPNRVSRQVEFEQSLSNSRTPERASSVVYQGFRYFRLLHDQVARSGAGLKNLVQTLVQLRAEEAPISPLGSSLLR